MTSFQCIKNKNASRPRGVAGHLGAEKAYKKIKNGASLIQLYTGLVYKGPKLINEINKGLIELIEKDGFKNRN